MYIFPFGHIYACILDRKTLQTALIQVKQLFLLTIGSRDNGWWYGLPNFRISLKYFRIFMDTFLFGKSHWPGPGVKITQSQILPQTSFWHNLKICSGLKV